MKKGRKAAAFCFFGVLASAMLLLPAGCGGGGGGGVSGAAGPAPTAPDQPGQEEAGRVTLLDAEGNPVDQLEQGDTVYFGVDGLAPGELYTITIKYPDGTEEQLNLSADETGTIQPSAALMYDTGLAIDPAERPAGRATGRFALAAGDSIQVVVSRGTTVVNNVSLSYSGSANDPSAFAANANGYFRNGFVCSEDIYATFMNFRSEKVRVYVVKDRIKWNIGDRLEDVSGGFEEIQPSYYSSFSTPILVWKNSGSTCAPVGQYDLVVERGNLDGFLEEGDIVDSHRAVGFMVQAAAGSAPIVEQIASDNKYNYKNIFDVNETIFVYMNPKVRSRVTEQISTGGFGVYKYVTHHKDTWAAGDSILDASQNIEGDIVQWGCYNEALVVVWPAPLTPGKYDIVIDANTNGKYDPGIDFLDNINENGDPEYGFLVREGGAVCSNICVDDSGCVDTDPDTVETCLNPATCNSACQIYKVTCDLQVDKVNYRPGEEMKITFTARNEGTRDVKCGAAVAPQKQNPDAVWNSFDDDVFIVIPAGHELTRTITKVIPTDWAPTDTSEGSDYDIYTVREDRTRWEKGDNFNIHVSKPCNGDCPGTNTELSCAVACSDDSGCSEAIFSPPTNAPTPEPARRHARTRHARPCAKTISSATTPIRPRLTCAATPARVSRRAPTRCANPPASTTPAATTGFPTTATPAFLPALAARFAYIPNAQSPANGTGNATTGTMGHLTPAPTPARVLPNANFALRNVGAIPIAQTRALDTARIRESAIHTARPRHRPRHQSFRPARSPPPRYPRTGRPRRR